MLKRTIFTLSALILSALSAQAGDRMIKPDAPEEVIRQAASRESAIRWKIPLGRALPEEMIMVAPGKLLVSLRKDVVGLPNLDYLLVDTASGAVRWRYSREKKKGSFQFLVARGDLLVFQIQEPKRFSLIALGAADGSERWSAPFEADTVRCSVAPDGDRILMEQVGGRETTLTVLDASTGAKLWTKKSGVAAAGQARTRWALGDVWHFARGVERLAGTDGHTVWMRDDLLFDENSPPAEVDGEELLVVHNGNRLSGLDLTSGRSRWSVELPAPASYTSVSPFAERIYVRGYLKPFATAAGGAGIPKLIAMSRQNPRLLWSYVSDAPVVSNLVEAKDRVYFATPFKLVALRLDTGAPVFAVPVTNSGRSFPVRLRSYPDKIVFIGEMIVAAYDPNSGNQVYRHGMTPVSLETSLTSLDSAIPRFKEEVAALRGGGSGTPLSKIFGDEAARSQELANAYRREEWSKRSSGDKLGADLAYSKSRIESRAAGVEATIAFYASLTELFASLRKALELSMVAGVPERQELFRRSIFSSYLAAENEDYVYRPNRRLEGDQDFTTLAVIHLSTGRRRDTVLSPTYLSYGLWNVVDFDNGLVFHHGIGLDPSAYQWSENQPLPAQGKVKTIQTFLIAAPVRIPGK